MQNTQLQEDVEVIELIWFLFVTEGILQMRRFRIVLTTGVFVEVVAPVIPSLISIIIPSHSLLRHVTHT